MSDTTPGARAPRALATQWRADADTFARYSGSQLADVCRRHADELDAAIRSIQGEALTLAEAAAESGYSKDRLRHMVADGTVPNAGRKGAPRVLRSEVPSKGRSVRGVFDAASVVRGLRQA